jgi:ubiquinone/menaquinone biosynthesis C-methylase UbiE
VPLPTLENVIDRTDKRIQGFILLAEGSARNILPRLRNKPVEFSETFEQDNRHFLTKFDKVLGNRIYSGMREAAFRFLKPEDRNWLKGKKMLDVGCGSGRETAELWLKLEGTPQITAIDPVAAMIEIGEKNFEILLKEVSPAHPPVTDNNRPIFQKANAMRLPFEDNTFDAAFMLFVLHWTPDPQQAVKEIIRVVKPGGIIFGGQAFRPEANPYFNLVIRTNQNCYGFFWREEFRRWFSEHGLEVEMTSPAGIFNVRKRMHGHNRPEQESKSV